MLHVMEDFYNEVELVFSAEKYNYIYLNYDLII